MHLLPKGVGFRKRFHDYHARVGDLSSARDMRARTYARRLPYEAISFAFTRGGTSANLWFAAAFVPVRACRLR